MTTKKPSESYLRTLAYLSTPPADRDTKTVRVAPGEYILPPATVDSVGVPNLDRLVTETNGQPPGDGQSAAQRILAYSPELGRRSDEARLKQMSPAKRRLYEFDASQPRGQSRSEPLNLRELAAQASLPAFATGGLVTDDLKPRPVTGAPGVERTGNSYAQAAPTPAPATAPKIETQAAWEGLSQGQRDQMLSGQNSGPARAGNVPGAPGVARSGNSYSQIAPTPGATPPNAGAGISQQDWERRPAAERDSLLGGGATGAQTPNATPSTTGSAVSQLAWENMPSNKRDGMLNGNTSGPTPTGVSFSDVSGREPAINRRPGETAPASQSYRSTDNNAIPAHITDRFQQLQGPNMGIKVTGPELAEAGRQMSTRPLPGSAMERLTSPSPNTNRVSTISGPSAADLNAQLERTRQLREENTALRDNLNFNAGGALSRQKTNTEIARELLTSPSRSARQAGVNLTLGAQEDARLRADAARTQPWETARLEGQELQNQAARSTQARLAQTDALIAEYGRTTDPVRRAALERELRIRSGQAQPQQQDPNLKTRADLIGELTKAYANLQPNRNGPPLPSFEEWSAPMLQAAGLQAAAAQAKPLPAGMTQAGLIAQAQQGLRNGLSLEAVNRRLREFGIGPIGG